MFPLVNLAAATVKLQQEAVEYGVDAFQRGILFWDIMRQRGNAFVEHSIQGKPPLLKFSHEKIADGATLPRPCNYSLLQIKPGPEHPATIPNMRPIVVIDPRAGHGPGIGGFKPDSQIGIALREGHPTYFVTFAPEPLDGQTLRDVATAEAHFLELIAQRHPDAPAAAVIGNCQAGWAVAALAAAKPGLMGPIMLNGAPLSYWAGSREQNPMRYSAGVLGGSWMSAFAADLGGDRFDGGYLISNFENLNLANTYWTKYYNVFAKADTEGPRFVEFERWWGGVFRMTGEEIESITRNLFIGNRLSGGEVIDLRNITSPVIVFASWGDDITPPAQALNWVIDVWGSEKALVQAGRTIVYLLHEGVGHLGIFVGTAVAKKEHDQLINALNEIEGLGPGLWQMVIETKSGPVRYESLTRGQYTVRFVQRSFDDLLALDPDGRDEEAIFSTIAKISEINHEAYTHFARPYIQPLINRQVADTLRSFNSHSMERVLASDVNPAMKSLGQVADQVREQRKPAALTNRFRKLEHEMSSVIEKNLKSIGDARDQFVANWVDAVYGPLGLGAWLPPEAPEESTARTRAERILAAASGRLQTLIDKGGFPEGVCRMLGLAIQQRGELSLRSVRLARLASEQVDRWIAEGRISAGHAKVDWEGTYDLQRQIISLFPVESAETLPLLLSSEKDQVLAAELVDFVLMREGEEPPEDTLADDLARIGTSKPAARRRKAAAG
ncbi:DUF3141 domain-containing protein [Uliginosibacterium sp. H1]|uniref:DUF3141 domain-containing protein n=1 Tax=Uliginosibacterium sp. H1 TaxID=3114757 RepID=UPI002E19E86E|nr:DUF3141 domain-containing protein [Uliginosibacterium sp. H1]